MGPLSLAFTPPPPDAYTAAPQPKIPRNLTLELETAQRLGALDSKRQAKLREQRRNANIKSSFRRLQTLIPHLPKDHHVPQIKLLRLATSYIAHLNSLLNLSDPDHSAHDPAHHHDQPRQQHSHINNQDFRVTVLRQLSTRASYKDAVASQLEERFKAKLPQPIKKPKRNYTPRWNSTNRPSSHPVPSNPHQPLDVSSPRFEPTNFQPRHSLSSTSSNASPTVVTYNHYYSPPSSYSNSPDIPSNITDPHPFFTPPYQPASQPTCMEPTNIMPYSADSWQSAGVFTPAADGFYCPNYLS